MKNYINSFKKFVNESDELWNQPGEEGAREFLRLQSSRESRASLAFSNALSDLAEMGVISEEDAIEIARFASQKGLNQKAIFRFLTNRAS